MNTKENKMGVMPVKQLIISMSLPMMLSMLVQALYNIVDSIFVAQIGEGEYALTAVTLAFPMQNLMIALSSGTGVGINALLSRSLGAKDFDKSDSAANNGLLLTFFNYIVFLIIGIFFAGRFINTQTTNPVIREYGAEYLGIICCCSLALFFQMTFERLLQSTGKTIYSMISQGTGAIINIIFDPLLIFGIGPFPELGVAGAAYATVFGQFVGCSIGIFCNLKFNKEINFAFKKIITPDLSTIKDIYFVGIPSILMMSIGSVMTYLMNLILGTFSSTATAVFGVYFKLQSFFFMPVFGLNNGLIPVLAYNYGARNKERIKEALKFALILALSIMCVGTVCFLAIPETLLHMFNASEDMVKIGIPALRTICLSFPLAGICIAMGSIFQAFSKSFYSLIISVGRQLVVLIPASWLLSKTGVLNNVWFAFPIAELASLVLSSFYFRKLYKSTVSTM
ncbi:MULTISPECIES: MATE family efflux transporter [unclassified Butyrivibrio]|uniref:MATE family efflux transporter n=1 Tax=unclassified Butyrivibrio TaxID=2639466 RepID=UPI0003B4C3FD|nr:MULTISPECIES: MATE family efflux transporter [unclassified Butyrivibrio]MDC7292274.1 MATE family efflux transporter [Butyrivibrio sp. DSM 10294]